MALDLTGMTIAILITTGFEQVEMTEPRKALEAAGAKTVIISPEKAIYTTWLGNKQIQAFDGNNKKWGRWFNVDIPVEKAKADNYDALLLPGGVMNPDALRINSPAVAFVKAFAHKPIAVICHGPWTLINAELVSGKKITSWPSLEADLTNAGAYWVDAPLVHDGNIISSRKPEDIPAFNKEFIKTLTEKNRIQRHDKEAAQLSQTF